MEGDFSHENVWFSSLRGALCLSHRGIALHKCYLSKKDAVETRVVSGMEQMVLGLSTAAPWSVNGFTPCVFFSPRGCNLQVRVYKLRIQNWVCLFLGTCIRVGFRSYLRSNSASLCLSNGDDAH